MKGLSNTSELVAKRSSLCASRTTCNWIPKAGQISGLKGEKEVSGRDGHGNWSERGREKTCLTMIHYMTAEG